LSADNAPKLSTGYLDRRSLVVGATLPIFISYPPGQKYPTEPVAWTISDESVATIRPQGALHEIAGLRPGTVTVRATQGIHDCIDTLHVVDPSAVKRVELRLEDDIKAHAPNRFQLVATAFYEHNCWHVITSDAGVAWSSSDESVAQISPSGAVLGQRDGDARVSIAFKGSSSHLDAHIENGVLAAFSQGLFISDAFLRVGVTTSIFPYFDATVRDWRPRSGALTLAAEPPGIVELAHASGDRDSWTLRGLRVGFATITVRLGTLDARKTIEVREARNPRFDEIRVEAADDRSGANLLFIDQESAAHVYLRDDGGMIDNCHEIVWSTSAPEVLSIVDSKHGVANVKGVAAGNVILRAECKPLGVRQERPLRVAEEPHIEWF
jgi:hypothetical protein